MLENSAFLVPMRPRKSNICSSYDPGEKRKYQGAEAVATADYSDGFSKVVDKVPNSSIWT